MKTNKGLAPISVLVFAIIVIATLIIIIIYVQGTLSDMFSKTKDMSDINTEETLEDVKELINVEVCDNSKDDDGDEKVDCDDEDCEQLEICKEKKWAATESNCFDGKDDDGDGLIDGFDKDCSGTLYSVAFWSYGEGISNWDTSQGWDSL